MKRIHTLTSTGLIVSLLVGGIWAAIARPCVSCSKMSEAKQYIGTMNRGQQAYYLEKQQFSSSIAGLEIGIKEKTEHYHYSMRTTPNAVFHYATPHQLELRSCRQCVFSLDFFNLFSTGCGDKAFCLWYQQVPCGHKSFAGIVYVDRSSQEPLTHTKVCVANTEDGLQLNPTYQNGRADCGKGAQDITR